MLDLIFCSSGKGPWSGRPWKPPSTAISRGRMPSPVELGRGLRQQRVLARVPALVPGGQDEAAGAAAGVLGDLADLCDVAELGRLAELALADRPGVGVGDRDQPVGDLEPADATVDLLGDLAGSESASSSSARGRRSFACAPRPRAEARAAAASRLASAAERAISLPACSLSAITCCFRLAGATARASARSPAPPDRPIATGRAP